MHAGHRSLSALSTSGPARRQILQRRMNHSRVPKPITLISRSTESEGYQDRLAQTRWLPALAQLPDLLDFTSDVIIESDSVNFGQSSDVSKGRCLELGIQVAVKRLRIGVGDYDSCKVNHWI